VFRRWILPILVILAAGAVGVWALATRADPDARPPDPDPRPAEGGTRLPERAPPFAILFGGELAGRMWIPPCSQFRQGGITRLGTLLREMGRDAGMWTGVDLGDVAGAPGAAGAEEYARGCEALFEMGISVAAVGEKDLLLGLDRWREAKAALPPDYRVLCANLRDEEGRELAPAVAHLVMGKKKVLVAAVLSPSFEKELRDAGVKVRILPPAETVRGALAAAGKADTVVLLSHAPAEESRAILRAVPEADVVLTAHAGTLPWMEPEIIDGRVLLAPGTGWQFVCGSNFRDMGPDRKPEFIANIHRAAGWTLEESRGHALVLDRLLGRIREEGFLEGVLREAAAARPEAEPRFAGPEACASCHPGETAKWREGPHAKSMEEPRRRKFDRVWNCLSCHATAPGRPGGHLAPGDAQAGVTCEACHGPGAAHVAADGRTPMEDAKASCLRCHVPEMSPAFDVLEKWPPIRHGR
jgi:hypothetical protein